MTRTDKAAIAVIPARGGSKGIHRKNLRLLAGKPLIAYTIEQALQSQGVGRVIVSTDDHEIAQVASQYGAMAVLRPVEISGDMASSESALLHSIEYLQHNDIYVPDLLVFLQCTSPLTLAEDIDGTMRVLLDQEADTAVAVTPFHYFIWQRSSEGGATGINHDKSVRLLRQQREPQYRETGAVYVMRTRGFLQAKHRFFGKTALYIMPQERCLEIDEPVDFQIAEVLLRERKQKQKLQMLPDPVEGLVLDFDGVFTDNKVIVYQDGSEAVICDRGDGLGLAEIKRLGIALLVLSTEKNPVVKARCDKLHIPCLQGVQDKLSALTGWTQQKQLNLSHIVYAGNDINDLSCLQAVGCGVTVNNAHPEAMAAAQIILDACGGKGAVRELTDLIMFGMKEE